MGLFSGIVEAAGKAVGGAVREGVEAGAKPLTEVAAHDAAQVLESAAGDGIKSETKRGAEVGVISKGKKWLAAAGVGVGTAATSASAIMNTISTGAKVAGMGLLIKELKDHAREVASVGIGVATAILLPMELQYKFAGGVAAGAATYGAFTINSEVNKKKDA